MADSLKYSGFDLGGNLLADHMDYSAAGADIHRWSKHVREFGVQVHDEVGNRSLKRDARLSRFVWRDGELITLTQLKAEGVECD